MKQRKILHVDLDAFFASVEQLDNPAYRNKPLIVGGLSQRGVVATCSYEARAFGVHSAQPGFEARKRCPQGIFVQGRMSRYSQVSKQVFEILRTICDHVEVVSIDEAYLDITSLYYSPMYVANYIKDQVKEKVGLTLSVGISYNKFLAKLASDWHKPNGIKVISQEEIPDILRPLSIKKVHGLGQKSVAKLNRIGIFTIDDLLSYDLKFIESFLGKYGVEIYDRIRGIDHRPVASDPGKAKSIGSETTLSKDAKCLEEVLGALKHFSDQISASLKKNNLVAHTITVKWKTKDFESHSKSKTFTLPVTLSEEIYTWSHRLLSLHNFEKPIRLIGISVSSLSDKSYEQLTLF